MSCICGPRFVLSLEEQYTCHGFLKSTKFPISGEPLNIASSFNQSGWCFAWFEVFNFHGSTEMMLYANEKRCVMKIKVASHWSACVYWVYTSKPDLLLLCNVETKQRDTLVFQCSSRVIR